MPNPVAVSSWALHRTLGLSFHDSPATGSRGEERHASPQIKLLELPAELARGGYGSMQLCHFHLPSQDASYCAQFRDALGAAGVELHALLIDEGDITHPEHGERDAGWVAGWLQTAEQLGAKHARVIAGKQAATPESLERSIERLKILVKSSPVRIEIENWFPLTDTPEAVLEILDRLEGHVGLCADWGNWPRPRKYDDLPKIMPRAETCHAKLEFLTPTAIDIEDAALCLAMAKAAKFEGAYVLVNGGPGESEWDALDLQRSLLSV